LEDETDPTAILDETDRVKRAVAAAAVRPLALDWLNGCRSPYNDGGLQGAVSGVTIDTDAVDLYTAVADGLVCGARTIVDRFRDSPTPVAIHRIVATGGLPHHAPDLMQKFSDMLDTPIFVHPSLHGPAVGAAIFGAVAAGAYPTVGEAVAAMAVTGVERDGVEEGSGGRNQAQQAQQAQQQQAQAQVQAQAFAQPGFGSSAFGFGGAPEYPLVDRAAMAGRHFMNAAKRSS
jgi:L-ribulokinase